MAALKRSKLYVLFIFIFFLTCFMTCMRVQIISVHTCFVSTSSKMYTAKILSW